LISADGFFRLLCAIGDAQKSSAPPIKIAQKSGIDFVLCDFALCKLQKSYAI